jgi:hypothetical protein
LKRKVEEIGNRKVEVEFHSGIASGESLGWETVLEDLLTNPSLIGCTLPLDTNKSGKGKIIVNAPENAYEASFTSRNKFGKAIKKNRTSGRRLLF